MTESEFARAFDVSRETCARLEIFVDLLKRWNEKINLVSPASLNAVWRRHIADSAQLLDLAPPGARDWLDLGAGAGLPGLPVAALAAEKAPGLRMTLIEADQRKAVFLRTALRETGLSATVVAERIEALTPRPCDVASARALAPLGRLCALARRVALPPSRAGAEPDTVFLFPKGKSLDSELTAATADWHIRCERIASRTDPEAIILRILELEPRA